jgi:alpha-glucosidase (family GH31 glycosyl hydrolase)
VIGDLIPLIGQIQVNQLSSSGIAFKLRFADAMIRELKELKVELMVSIWPQVDKLSENYEEMLEKGFLIRTDRGIRTVHDFQGQTVHFDPTNPDARKFVWGKVRKNYYEKGVKVFWLDEAEPECEFTRALCKLEDNS